MWCTGTNPIDFLGQGQSVAKTLMLIKELVTGRRNYLTKMCSGSQVGSFLRRIDFVYHSTLGLRVIKKKKDGRHLADGDAHQLLDRSDAASRGGG